MSALETTARAAAQNRGWERRGERLRRQALARDSDPALLVLCHADRALYDDLVFGELEYDGFFVVVGCDVEVWPEVGRRLRAAGFSWLNVADEEPAAGDRLVCDVVDAWRGACVWGCGRVYADVEAHVARCPRRDGGKPVYGDQEGASGVSGDDPCQRAAEGEGSGLTAPKPPQGAAGAGAGVRDGRKL